MVRSKEADYPNVWGMNSFFYPTLRDGGHEAVKRWTKNIDLFENELIIIPIHLGEHWALVIVEFRQKSISYYDSMGEPNPRCLDAIQQYIAQESLIKKHKKIDFTDWKIESVPDIPQQNNSSDCGVFCCVFAEYLCAGKTLNFSSEDMPYFRKKIMEEILSCQIQNDSTARITNAFRMQSMYTTDLFF